MTPIAITVPEAVRLTGMSRSALYDALKQHKIKAKKAGRRTLFLLADLEAFMGSLPGYEPEA